MAPYSPSQKPKFGPSHSTSYAKSNLFASAFDPSKAVSHSGSHSVTTVKGEPERDSEVIAATIRQSLFNFTPAKAFAADNASYSKSTRDPGDFDTHMDDTLILKRVRYLPAFREELANIAEQSLLDCAQLPPLPTKKGSFLVILDDLAVRTKKFVNEKCVEDTYDKFANSCVIAAATLHFHLPEWSEDYLEWNKIGSAPPGYSNAVADGFLKLKDTCLNTPGDTGDIASVYRLFRDIVNWEFKSLSAGSEETLEAIMEATKQTEVFPWYRCTDDQCGYKHVDSEDGSPKKTGSRMGPDANNPPFAFTCDENTTWGEPTNEIDPPYHASASKILQQVWGEAVDNDTTFGVIHAGKFEILCLRSRADQTLYISDLIRVDECKAPGYGQIHCGLYIAAIKDAVDRASQILKGSATIPTWSDYRYSNTVGKTRPEDKNAPLQRTKLPLKSVSRQTPVGLKQRIVDKARSRRVLIVTPPRGSKDRNLGYEPYRPHFRRADPELGIPTPALPHGPASEIQPYLSLTTRLRVQNNVFSGHKLTVDGDCFTSKAGFGSSFILKIGNDTSQIARLNTEHFIYTWLRSRDITGIPQVLGCYCDETSNPNFILVLEHVGTPLPKYTNKVTKYQRTQFIDTLKAVHGAGYLHGHLDRKCLLIHPTNDQAVFIVGFGEAQTWHKEGAKHEIEELKYLIDDKFPQEKKLRPDIENHCPPPVDLQGPTGDYFRDKAAMNRCSPSEAPASAWTSSSTGEVVPAGFHRQVASHRQPDARSDDGALLVSSRKRRHDDNDTIEVMSSKVNNEQVLNSSTVSDRLRSRTSRKSDAQARLPFTSSKIRDSGEARPVAPIPARQNKQAIPAIRAQSTVEDDHFVGNVASKAKPFGKGRKGTTPQSGTRGDSDITGHGDATQRGRPEFSTKEATPKLSARTREHLDTKRHDNATQKDRPETSTSASDSSRIASSLVRSPSSTRRPSDFSSTVNFPDSLGRGTIGFGSSHTGGNIDARGWSGTQHVSAEALRGLKFKKNKPADSQHDTLKTSPSKSAPAEKIVQYEQRSVEHSASRSGRATMQSKSNVRRGV